MSTRTRLQRWMRSAAALFGAVAFTLTAVPAAFAGPPGGRGHYRGHHGDHGRVGYRPGQHYRRHHDHGHHRKYSHKRHHRRHHGYARGRHHHGHHGKHAHKRHYKHHRKHNHVRHHGHHDGYRYGYGARYGYGYRDYYRPHPGSVYYHESPYYCAPCQHYFRGRHDFHGHIHQRHRIPLVEVPFVIVRSALGWIFYG